MEGPSGSRGVKPQWGLRKRISSDRRVDPYPLGSSGLELWERKLPSSHTSVLSFLIQTMNACWFFFFFLKDMIFGKASNESVPGAWGVRGWQVLPDR